MGSTVSVFNALVSFALSRNHQILLPPLLPSHKSANEFPNFFDCDAKYDFFLHQLRTESFATRTSTYLVVNASCPKDTICNPKCTCKPHAAKLNLPPSMPSHLVAQVKRLYLHGESPAGEDLANWIRSFHHTQPRSSAAVTVLVVLDGEGVAAHWGYSSTQPMLQQWYNRQHPFPYQYKTRACPSPGRHDTNSNEFLEDTPPQHDTTTSDLVHPTFGRYKLTVAVHVRIVPPSVPPALRPSKYLPPDYYVPLLKVIHELVPQACMALWLISELPNHPNITYLAKAFPHMNVRRHQWDGIRRHVHNGTFVDFHKLVHSNILLASKSNFARFAALISEHVTIAPPRTGYQLPFHNVITLELNNNSMPVMLGVKEKLASLLHEHYNPILQNCTTYLTHKQKAKHKHKRKHN
eukprot:TRINITY_DN24920_c0_g1_i1.p1 TRINITY_DN24920_c0_g1~~TRINITY_DN24920_c0_g1_i1.p1  ORF type:complete len:448 (-),score=25.76 TRINITY_DN24920_c0_g1_i1:78-1301(-)